MLTGLVLLNSLHTPLHTTIQTSEYTVQYTAHCTLHSTVLQGYLSASYIRHKDFFRLPPPSFFVLRHAQGTPQGFFNGLDWRALVKLRPPNIGKEGCFLWFFFFLKKNFFKKKLFFLDFCILSDFLTIFDKFWVFLCFYGFFFGYFGLFLDFFGFFYFLFFDTAWANFHTWK